MKNSSRFSFLFAGVFIFAHAFCANGRAANCDWTRANIANCSASPTYWQTLQYADLNGDGLMDLCARGTGGIYCAFNGPHRRGALDV